MSAEGQTAGELRIKAAYLVDPVDNSTFTPTSPAYPSAYDALKASGKTVGISGASLLGACNANGTNFEARMVYSHLRCIWLRRRALHVDKDLSLGSAPAAAL